jgi:hypothetical protein
VWPSIDDALKSISIGGFASYCQALTHHAARAMPRRYHSRLLSLQLVVV